MPGAVSLMEVTGESNKGGVVVAVCYRLLPCGGSKVTGPKGTAR